MIRDIAGVDNKGKEVKDKDKDKDKGKANKGDIEWVIINRQYIINSHKFTDNKAKNPDSILSNKDTQGVSSVDSVMVR